MQCLRRIVCTWFDTLHSRWVGHWKSSSKSVRRRICLEALEARTLLAGFPFSLVGDRFYFHDAPTFLNGIVYQPLEPGQDTSDEIREARWTDDLRRLAAFRGQDRDPLVLRIPLQPTDSLPDRLPQSFYDGLRNLDVYLVQDIFFSEDYQAADSIERGRAKVDSVIEAMERAQALDRVLYFEIGNEFHEVPANTEQRSADLSEFVCSMASQIKTRMAAFTPGEFSPWVSWASWPPYDPLRTDGIPVVPPCLDIVAYNAYPYDPERIRDHQAGPLTGTPYEGYVTAMKERYPNLPFVISETGLPDSPSAVGPAGSEQDRLPRRYPSYSRGGLSPEQVSEAIEDQYWYARLGGAAGVFIFSWNDEWHKFDEGAASTHDDHPEEYFGMSRFDPFESGYELRFKLHAAKVEELFDLDFPSSASIVEKISPAIDALSPGDSTIVEALVTPDAVRPVHFRWESSVGRVVGDTERVQFFAGDIKLGPARITAIAIDATGRASVATTTIEIVESGPPAAPHIELLTLGVGPLGTARASGRVENADLTQYKLVAALETDRIYFAPYSDMNSIWIDAQGYWWTTVPNANQGRLRAWLVPKEYDPPAELPSGSTPDNVLSSAERESINDEDNDLLDDAWEQTYLGTLAYDRYDDQRCEEPATVPPQCVGDGDGANHLEEFVRGTRPDQADNDDDRDGLWDTWEEHFFRTLDFVGTDDPDSDGLLNSVEQQLQTHPGRTAHDRDLDGLPDNWEREYFGGAINALPEDRLRDSQLTVGDAYELAFWRSANPWRNPREHLDVTADGNITPQDALVVINDLNFRGSRKLPVPSIEGPPMFLDAFVDDFVTPLDVLSIINYLNGALPGEGEHATPTVPSPLTMPTPDVILVAALTDVYDIRVDQSFVVATSTTSLLSAQSPLLEDDVADSPLDQTSALQNSVIRQRIELVMPTALIESVNSLYFGTLYDVTDLLVRGSFVIMPFGK